MGVSSSLFIKTNVNSDSCSHHLAGSDHVCTGLGTDKDKTKADQWLAKLKKADIFSLFKPMVFEFLN